MTANDLWWYQSGDAGFPQVIDFKSSTVTDRGLFATAGARTVPDVLPPRPSPVPGDPPISGDPALGTLFKVALVDMTGTVIAPLTHANVSDITWTLNDSTTASFKAPKHDPSTALVDPVVTEAQISFNGDLLFFGPILTRSASSGDGEVSFAARGADWFLTRRMLGMPPETPLIPNGSFEDGLATWVPTMVDGATATVVTAPALTGEHALKIVWHKSPEYAAMFVHGIPNVSTSYISDAPFMGSWTVEAWCQITEMRDPGAGVLLSLDGTRSGGTKGDIVIPSEFELNKWFRMTASAFSAPYGTMEIKLWAVDGTILWDAVRVFDDGAWGPIGWHNDTAELANIAIRSAQYRSDVNLGVDSGASGIHWPEARWKVQTHTRWSQVVDSIRDYGGGFDCSVEVTPETRTWTVHAPTKGVARDVILKLGAPSDGGMIASYSWGDDGSVLTNAAIMQGDGPDGNKTEAAYTDLSMFDGIELDAVGQAEEGVPIGDFDRVAEDYVTDSDTVDDQLSVKCHNAGYDFIRDMDTGDTVPVDIVDGAVTVNGTWRVIQKKLNGSDLTVDLTLVRV